MMLIRGFASTVMVVVGSAAACSAPAEPREPNEKIATTQQTLLDLDPEVYGGSTSVAASRAALRLGQFIARTPEFAACVLNPRPDPGLGNIVGASRRYRPCVGAPDCASGATPWDTYCPDHPAGRTPAALLLSALSTNHVIISHDTLPGTTNGQSCPLYACVDHFPGEWFDERMTLDSNFVNSNSAAAVPLPWPWNGGSAHPSRVAGTIFHEAMHTHRYGHGDNSNPSTASTNCGFSPSDNTWQWQRNAGPQVVQGCIDNIASGLSYQFSGNNAGRGPFGRTAWAGSGAAAFRYVGDNIVEKRSREYLALQPFPGALSPFTPTSPYPPVFQSAYASMLGTPFFNPDDLDAQLLDILRRGSVVPSAGAFVDFNGIAAGKIDGVSGTQQVVLAGVDQAGSVPYWRYRVGSDCVNPATCACGPENTLSLGAEFASPAGVALRDFNGDGKKDIVIAAIDNWRGSDPFNDPFNDYFRFRIGTNCTAGGACSWGPIMNTPTLSNGTDKTSNPIRGAVAAGDLDNNGVSDLFMVAIDREARFGARLVFAVGMNCSGIGACTWSTGNIQVGTNTAFTGAGVAIGDFDGNPSNTEVVLSATDHGGKGWRFTLGRCAGVPATCSFNPVQSLFVTDNLAQFGRARLYDGGAAATDVRGMFGLSLSAVPGDQFALFARIAPEDNTSDGAEWRDTIGWRTARACDLTTNVCDFGLTRVQETGLRDLTGAGGALLYAPQTGPHVAIAAVDARPDADPWFFGTTEFRVANSSERFAFGPYDKELTDLAGNNDTLAAATLISIPHNWQYAIDRAAVACPQELGAGCGNDVDIYRFRVASTRTVTINMTHQTQPSCRGDLDLHLLNSGGAVIGSSAKAVTGGPVTETITQTLAAGTYFIKVFGYDYASFCPGVGAGIGTYTLTVN